MKIAGKIFSPPQRGEKVSKVEKFAVWKSGKLGLN
jgi:hypothetical protein